MIRVVTHDEAEVKRRPCGRRRALHVAGLWSLVALGATSVWGQPRDVQRNAAGTASISGRVLAGSPLAPLRDARVTARAQMGRVTASVSTDADGRYVLTGLPAGRYTVTASKGGYVTLQYGQSRAFESGTPLEIEAEERLTRVDLALPRGSVLTGLVLDQHGQPAVGAAVRAQRYGFASGRWDLVRVGREDQTDDRGVYRLFGLAPGEYYLEATASRVSGSASRGPTYYPNATDLGSAQRVSVGRGEELGGLDVYLTAGEAAHVSGTVVDAMGRPQLRARSVSLVGRNPPGLRVRSGQIQADGAFVIDEVPPGDYVLYASSPAGDGPVEFAVVDVRTGGGDVEGILLRTTPGATATGTIAVQGGAAVPFVLGDLQLFTMPLGFVDVPVGRGVGAVSQDWRFEINGMGDAQLIRLLGLPDGWVGSVPSFVEKEKRRNLLLTKQIAQRGEGGIRREEGYHD